MEKQLIFLIYKKIIQYKVISPYYYTIMLLTKNNMLLAKVLKNSLKSTSTLTLIPHYNYIKRKEIDDIIQSHGTSFRDKLSITKKLTKCITSHAWNAFKHDVKAFYELRQR